MNFTEQELIILYRALTTASVNYSKRINEATDIIVKNNIKFHKNECDLLQAKISDFLDKSEKGN